MSTACLCRELCRELRRSTRLTTKLATKSGCAIRRSFGLGSSVIRACLLLALPARAGYIAFDITPATALKGGAVVVSAAISNTGNEPAMTVRAAAEMGARRAEAADPRETLAPGETMRVELPLGSVPAVPGAYTIVVRVGYTDVNGRPYSCLSSVPLVTDFQPGSAEPALAVSNAVLQAKGPAADVTVAVSARAGETFDGTLTLHLPDELTCAAPSRAVHVERDQTSRTGFAVANRGALPGSVYRALAIFDYESGGLHHSVTREGRVRVPCAAPFPVPLRPAAIVLLQALLAAFLACQLRARLQGRPSRVLAASPWRARVFPACVLAAIALFTLYHFPPRLLLLDTMTVGGDTPAHNYMASHLRSSLFGHGRVISWAGGWWSGFPLFQFYFPLPYLLIALLSVPIPFNIAFKLVSVLGIFALPPAAFFSARRARLPRPIPALLAVGMVPVLFDGAHTMWGVNCFSTLAGMIANSLSFPLMLLAVACAWRDANDGRFRVRTVLLLAALIASHFFTTLVAALLLAVVPLLRPRAGFRAAVRTLALEGGLAALLMGWWLLPLIGRQDQAVAFGTNWNVGLLATVPLALAWLAAPAAAALPLAWRDRVPFVALLAWMLAVSVLLFYFGYDGLGDVFVNIRFWPFILFAFIALAACGAGLLLRRARAPELAILAALLLAFLGAARTGRDVRAWAQWNYEGLEGKYRHAVFEKLVLPLRGTPGRLVNDLHPLNETLGSSRIFETVPHLTGKPVLEGGILTSAAGSLFAYYVQGETSRNSAGLPNRVKPATFDFARATRHLELFNVKHFIARGERTKQALAESSAWHIVAAEQGWELHELTTHQGRYVFIPKNHPVAVDTPDWQEAGLEWIYTEAVLDQPFAFLEPGDTPPDTFKARFDWPHYLDYVRGKREGRSTAILLMPTRNEGTDAVTREEVTDDHIRFTTSAIGLPHIIKCSWYPNWKVRGARHVYRVSPSFMLVYPTQSEVVLTYGATPLNRFAYALTLIGLAALGFAVYRAVHGKVHGIGEGAAGPARSG